MAAVHPNSGCIDVPRRNRGCARRVCIDRTYRFKSTDDAAQVWCSWVEMELRHDCFDEALSVIRQAVANTPNTKGGLHKSLRLWNLALDLEESLGGFENTRASYDRVIELGVATPQIIRNYASYLKQHTHHEQSYTVYERGLELFPFPHLGALVLWTEYLTNFEERYGGSKLERLRDLYERCLDPETSPSQDDISNFYIRYAKLEEQYGLSKRALSVYERMCTAILSSPSKRISYELYISKATQFLGGGSGLSKIRPIYETAISSLDDLDAAKICLSYAALETKLGELDRARTVYTYGAQMADPRRFDGYWKEWHSFEVKRGSEDTFRDMLRIKRAVSAAFSTVNYNAAEMTADDADDQKNNAKSLTDAEAIAMITKQEGIQPKRPTIGGFVTGKRGADDAGLEVLERQAARLRGAGVNVGSGGDGDAVAHVSKSAAVTVNADAGEIDLDDGTDEEDDDDDDVNASSTAVTNVEMKHVPAGVFGGLAAGSATESQGTVPTMGALARLQASKATDSNNTYVNYD
mmetsp:Transcript_53718/g.64694  ORF Transcript_53718/g.64694 Transcript_53718/m.64694 type:complete len:523 (-) Transcript_53718:306-1874(-)